MREPTAGQAHLLHTPLLVESNGPPVIAVTSEPWSRASGVPGAVAVVPLPCGKRELDAALTIASRHGRPQREAVEEWSSRDDARALYAAIVEGSCDAIVGVGAGGEVRFFSAGAQAMFGWSRAEVLDKPFDLLVGDWSKAKTSATCCTSGGPAAGPHRLLGTRKDGSTFVACIGFSAARGLQIASVRDMSEQQSLEQQLLQAQKMESVGLLAAGVAHDFNNAILALRAQLYVLSTRISEAAGLSDCEAILERCAGLAGWLLSVSSPSAAAQGAGVACDLKQTVSEAVSMARRLFPKRILLEIELPERPVLVRLDVNLSVHVLMNLLINARDAVVGNGSVKVCVTTSTSRGARLTVEDTGQGMTGEVLSRAFEPFFTTKPSGKGTGLGLPSVKRIVEAAGGRVSVYSQAGRGTCVTVELPDAPELQPADILESA